MTKKYTKELLEPIVSQSKSLSDVMRAVGIKCNGGNFRFIKQKIQDLDLDMSHFTGQTWSKGLTIETDQRVTRKNTNSVLKSGVSLRSSVIKRLMLKEGVEYRCKICNNDGNWMNKSLSLHIDHVDGDNRNNEIHNLRFLCPNCHQQTPTWGNKKSVDTGM